MRGKGLMTALRSKQKMKCRLELGLGLMVGWHGHGMLLYIENACKGGVLKRKNDKNFKNELA